jgi:hypothetical protein
MDFLTSDISHVYLVSTIEVASLIDIFPACQREFLTVLGIQLVKWGLHRVIGIYEARQTVHVDWN